MANLELNSGESILFDGPGTYVYENNATVNGRCLITSTRVIFCTHSKATPGFLISLFKLKAKTVLFEIPMNSVISLEQREVAKVKGATFHVFHTAGDYKFTFLLSNKYTIRWTTGFQSAVEAAIPGARMVARENRIDIIYA